MKPSKLSLVLVLVVLLATLSGFDSAFAEAGVRCAPTGVETVATDKQSYLPEETVTVTGSRYSADCEVVVVVTRPDGSVVTGDGTETAGSDAVTTDGDGSLSYSYILPAAIEGEYQVAVLGENDAVLASTTFLDTHIVKAFSHSATTNCSANFVTANEREVFERGETVCAQTSNLSAPSPAPLRSYEIRFFDPITPAPRNLKQGTCFPVATGVTTRSAAYTTLATDELSAATVASVSVEKSARWQIDVPFFSAFNNCTGTVNHTPIGPVGPDAANDIGFRLVDAWSFDDTTDRALCINDTACDSNDTPSFVDSDPTIHFRVRGYFPNLAAGTITLTPIDPTANPIPACAQTAGSSSNGTVDVNFSVSCLGTPAPAGNWQVRVVHTASAAATQRTVDVSAWEILVSNQVPSAVDDTATTAEDSAGVNTNVLANDSGLGDAPISVTIDTQGSDGVATVQGDNTITYVPNANFNGTDTYTYEVCDVDDECDTADVEVTISAVNDAPVLTVTPTSVTGQYSDPIDTDPGTSGPQPISISATDIDSPGTALTFSLMNGACTSAATLPDLTITPAAGSGSGTIADPGNRTATFGGRLNVAPATYMRCIVVTDGADTDAQTVTVTVNKEDASITDVTTSLGSFVSLNATVDPDNDKDVNSLSVSGKFVEASDGFPSSTLSTYNSAYGETDVRFDLNAIAAASNSKNCTDTGVTTPSGSTVSCNVTDLKADVYEIAATIQGAWFTGTGAGTFVVNDPSAGFATGGGSILWNGYKVNYGFTGKLLNKNVKCGLITVIHTPDGSYVTKSNSCTGFTNAKIGSTNFWATTMSGKATYATPESVVNPFCSVGVRKCGNFTFYMYAEDRGEPGTSDAFKIKLVPPSGSGNVYDIPLTTLQSGNNQIPKK